MLYPTYKTWLVQQFQVGLLLCSIAGNNNGTWMIFMQHNTGSERFVNNMVFFKPRAKGLLRYTRYRKLSGLFR